MTSAGLPRNELERISTLRSLGILDTEFEERFDRVTRMAKRLFHVPIAIVSLTDENRQWFKSCVGLDIRETPREASFCAQTIFDSDIFHIIDASKDERFQNNPLVRDAPHIRFYAGYPLRAPNGDQLGTLCILDSKARKLTSNDMLNLKDLAAMVEQELNTYLLATMDELTNVCNRRGFLRLAKHSISLCKRQELSTSIAYFDLDDFKPINDRFGHLEGDKALKIFTYQLQQCFRDSDIIARIGGDEFIALLTSTQGDSAEQMIHRLSQELEKTCTALELKYHLTFSYGIAELDWTQEQDIETIIEQADQRMYRKKALKKKTMH